MDINKAFPTKYLSAHDISGKEPVVMIARVMMEEIEDGKDKPVVYFNGAQKGLVLNKTNSMNITTLYGPETDNWVGKTVQLYTTWVDFQGRSVEAIRVKPQAPNQPSTEIQQPQDNWQQAGQAAPDIEDEIPF